MFVELLPLPTPRDAQHAENHSPFLGQYRHGQIGQADLGVDLGVFLAPDQILGDASQFLVVPDVGDTQGMAMFDDPAGQPFSRSVLYPLRGHFHALHKARGAAQDVATGDVVAQEYGRTASIEPVASVAHNQRHQTIAIQLAVDFQQFLVESEHLTPCLLEQV